MKNLVLSTLIAAAASQAAGCIIFSDDDGGGLGDIRVSWSLKSTDVNVRDAQNPAHSLNPDVNAGCPAGATTATLFALPVGAPVSSAFQDKYDCIDGIGTIADLEPGLYTVWIQLQDTSGATKFAESFSQDVSVVDGAVTPVSYDVYTDRGFFFVGWNLFRGGAQTCRSIANNGVSIISTDSGGLFFEDLVDCEEGEGGQTITQPLPVRPVVAGTDAAYSVVLSLLNAQDQSIGDSTATPDRNLPNFGGSTTDLGIIQINVR